MDDQIRRAGTLNTWWLALGTREWHFPYATAPNATEAIALASCIQRAEAANADNG